jgi:SNF2 family DNA or RNA helicase
MMDDIEECVNEGSKVIVWSRFKRDNRDLKKRLLEQFNIESGVFDSGTKQDERQAIIDRFNRDDSFRVFIGNPGAGGVGLTLLGSDKVPVRQAFYYSNDFQYGKRVQSEDRCHRIGLKNSILYKDYVYLNTIEEYIAECLQKKKDVSDAVKNVGEIKELLLRQRG